MNAPQILTYKLDKKRVWNKAFLAQEMQNFIRKVDVQPPKSLCNLIHLDKIEPEINHFEVAKYKIFLGKEACNLHNS